MTSLQPERPTPSWWESIQQFTGSRMGKRAMVAGVSIVLAFSQVSALTTSSTGAPIITTPQAEQQGTTLKEDLLASNNAIQDLSLMITASNAGQLARITVIFAHRPNASDIEAMVPIAFRNLSTTTASLTIRAVDPKGADYSVPAIMEEGNPTLPWRVTGGASTMATFPNPERAVTTLSAYSGT